MISLSHARYLEELDTPALVLDMDILEANISRMQSAFAGPRVRLMPHFKTHKCVEIARRQIEAGAKGITCAKLGEAEVLVEAEFDNILVANQIVGEVKIRRLAQLARRSNITVAVDSARNIVDLSAAATAAGATIGIYVEIDVGMRRCGVRPGRPAVELAKLAAASPGLQFRGLQGYEGHVVLQREGESKEAAAADAYHLMSRTKGQIESAGVACRESSGGGTGTWRAAAEANGILSELQAGSYATMDARYASVTPEFGVALGCVVTVMSRPTKYRAIGDAGLKSLSTEFGLPVVAWPPGVVIERLSEEHVLLRLTKEGAACCDAGGRIVVTPSHGCTTINLHDELQCIREGRVEGRWRVAARGKAT